jgi:hypothetical protein
MVENHMEFETDENIRASEKLKIEEIPLPEASQTPTMKRTFTDLNGGMAHKKSMMDFRREINERRSKEVNAFTKQAPTFGGVESESGLNQDDYSKPLLGGANKAYRTRTDLTGHNKRAVESLRKAGEIRQGIKPINFENEDKKINMITEIAGIAGDDKSVKDYMSDIMEVFSKDGKEDQEFTKKDDKIMAEKLHAKAWKNYEEAKRAHEAMKP